jgi:hypothetical protein
MSISMYIYIYIYVYLSFSLSIYICIFSGRSPINAVLHILGDRIAADLIESSNAKFLGKTAPRILPPQCLFIAVCEYSQALVDVQIGHDAIRHVLAHVDQFPLPWIDFQIAAIDEQTSRSECFMQIVLKQAMLALQPISDTGLLGKQYRSKQPRDSCRDNC